MRLRSVRRLLKRRVLVAGVTLAVVAVAATIGYVAATKPSTQYRTTSVVYGTITQTLPLSGNLVPSTETDLDFKVAGLVSAVNVQAGQTVAAGAVLATIDTSSLEAALLQAQATLATAQAKLALDSAGPTAISLAQANLAVTSAENGLANAQTNQADTAAQNTQNVSVAQGAVTQAQATVTADQATVAADQAQLATDQQTMGTDCGIDPASAQCTADKAKVAADQTRLGADQVTLAKDQAALASSQIALQSAQLKAQQSNDGAKQQIASAQIQVQSAQLSLSSLEQGVTAQQLQVDRAQVAVAQVGADAAQKNVDAATLVAPATGVVTAVNLTAGQSVSGPSSGSSSAATTATHQIAIVSPGSFQVTGTVSDALVGQIALGQAAEITPAGRTEALAGRVTAIASQATVTSGVASFPVTVQLTDPSSSLRSGMSASVVVILSRVVHVLAVPTAAVRGGSSVQVLKNGLPQTVAVQVGASDAFLTQILSGLNLGDTVVLATITSSVPAQTSRNGLGGGGFGGGGFGGGGGGTRAGG